MKTINELREFRDKLARTVEACDLILSLDEPKRKEPVAKKKPRRKASPIAGMVLEYLKNTDDGILVSAGSLKAVALNDGWIPGADSGSVSSRISATLSYLHRHGKVQRQKVGGQLAYSLPS